MELISKVSVHPDHRFKFRNIVDAVAVGNLDGLTILFNRGTKRRITKQNLMRLIDEMNGEAVLYSVGLHGKVTCDDMTRANRLFNTVWVIEKRLE